MEDYFVSIVLLSAVPLFAAFLMIIMGRASLKYILKKERECLITTIAEIVDIKELKHPTGKRGNVIISTYHPVFQYIVGDRIYRNTYTYGATTESYYTIGDTKEICYNPNNRNSFYLKDDCVSKKRAKHVILAGVIITIIVAIFILLSVIQYNHLYG